jgi:6-hydroxytryprostatin B O-methyltransferase
VPLTGSISYSELAKKVNILESRLKRVIRHALNNHVFWAPTRDTIAHTSTSAEVVRDPLLFAWLGHNFDQVTPGTLKVLDSMKECKESEDLMQTGVSMAFGLKEDLYSWMSKDGEGEPGKDVLEGKVDNRDRAVGWRERRFGNAIKCVTAGGRHAAHHVNRGFDWGSLGKGTVVDVSPPPFLNILKTNSDI